jgi:hypothetical protein
MATMSCGICMSPILREKKLFAHNVGTWILKPLQRKWARKHNQMNQKTH